MALDEVSGGTPPRTTSTNAPSEVRDTATSTTTTTTPTRRTGGTAFHRRPLRDPDAPALDEAARRNARPEPKPTSDKPKSEDAPKDKKPKGEDKPDRGPSTLMSPDAIDRNREARERREAKDKPLSNDGEAQFLVDGKHVGDRDAAIEELKQKQSELEAEGREIREDIDELEEEIESDEGKADAVGTAVSVATAPVTMVAGLFGASNPISDAAKSAAENLLGLQEDKAELEQREDDLASQTEQIEAEIKRLENERTLNFLAATAYTTGMEDEVADFIETGEIDVNGDLHVKLNVADETGTGSDGVFDSGTNDITVDSELLEEASEHLEKLKDEGIVDADGNIIDAEAFDASAEGDQVIKTVSTMAVHEVNHAAQHAAGEFEPAFLLKRQIVRDAFESLPADATPEQAKEIIEAAMAEGERVRTAAIEVPSYVLQEQNDMRAGAQKKAFITVDEQGEELPFEQQVDNVLAYVAGEPLVHGPSTGYVRSGAAADAAEVGDDHDHGHDHGAEGEHSHDHTADAFRGPAFRGPAFRGPSWLADAHLAAGFDADAFRGPGEAADAFRGPAWMADAFRGPAFRGPGDVADAFRGPAWMADAFRGPGEVADAFRGPAWMADAFRGPAFRGPGDVADAFRGPAWIADAYAAAGFDADAFRGPAFRGPAWMADAFRGPGEVADAFRGPAWSADAFRGPGEVADGESADGWLADAFAAAGYEADAFRGPAFRGPAWMADAFRGPAFRGPGEVADGESADAFRGPAFRGPAFRGPGEVADAFRGPGLVISDSGTFLPNVSFETGQRSDETGAP